MEITREELEQIVKGAVDSAVAAVQDSWRKSSPAHCGGASVENPTGTAGGKSPGNPRSAYAKTESLLYNYKGFVRIVQQRLEEIRSLRECGVPERSKSIVEWSPGGNPATGIILPSESVESAIANVQASVEKILRVLDMVDRAMEDLEGDPYFPILRMQYFERMKQEQIAVELGCSQVTVSKNKGRLVKEMALRLFPEQILDELIMN